MFETRAILKHFYGFRYTVATHDQALVLLDSSARLYNTAEKLQLRSLKEEVNVQITIGLDSMKGLCDKLRASVSEQEKFSPCSQS